MRALPLAVVASLAGLLAGPVVPAARARTPAPAVEDGAAPEAVPTPAAAASPAAEDESGGLSGFHGGGGLFVLPAFYDLGSWSGWGVWLGGGGFSYVWRDWLRVGGMGAEAFLGDEDSTQYRFNYGGIFVDWVFHPLEWLELPIGFELGFGSGRFDRVRPGPADPGSYPGATRVDRTTGFVILTTPTVGVGFIPLHWLKIAVIGRFTYGHWWPDPGWGVGGGVSIFFGRFRDADD